MSEYQEEVLTNLLDLQAELRGDEPEPHDEPAAQASSGRTQKADVADSQETVAVTDESVTVSVSSPASSRSLGVNERLAALNVRLAQLEHDLAGVTKRIERIEPDPEVVSSGDTDADVDPSWHSFLDLQRIVADRLDQP